MGSDAIGAIAFLRPAFFFGAAFLAAFFGAPFFAAAFFGAPSSARPSSRRPSCRPSSARPSSRRPSWRPSSARPSSQRPSCRPFLRRGLLRCTHRQCLGAWLLDGGVFCAHLVKLLLKPLLEVARLSSGRPCSRSRNAPVVPARQVRWANFIGPAIGSALPRRTGTSLLPVRELHPTYPAWGSTIPARHGRTHPDERRAMTRHIALRAAIFAKLRAIRSPTMGDLIGLASPGRGCGPWTVLLLSGGLHRSLESAMRIGYRHTKFAIHRAMRSCQ